MRHQPQSPAVKEMFTGPRQLEQKPQLCSKCGAPIARAYRIYQQQFNSKLGRMEIVRGQYEVAHYADGQPVFDGCPVPGLLEILRDKVAAEDNVFTDKKIVHKQDERAAAAGITRVLCGAKGSLWTTLDTEATSCSNCKVRMQQDQSDLARSVNKSNQIQKEGQTEMATPTSAMNQAIKDKIAAAKANKVAQAKAGTAGNLVSKDDEGVPLPTATKTGKAAKVTKQQVQTAKAAPKPTVLNLCGCGCGEAVKSSFRPGHDAKLHGWVKKLAAGKMSLSEVAGQVKDGMYKGVKQTAVKDGEGNLVLAGVNPSTSEAEYLEMLKGKGGAAE